MVEDTFLLEKTLEDAFSFKEIKSEVGSFVLWGACQELWLPIKTTYFLLVPVRL
jgi:hypothetical protein